MTVTQNGQRARQARRRRRPEDSDWLSLVEPVGQFLTAPVLRSAFPVGLPPVPPELRSQARERLATAALTANDSADRAAWFDWLLRVVLGWGDLYVAGDEAASVVREVPEYRTTLRADGILRDPAGRIRALVMRVPFGARFDARIAGEEWSASPLDRITELARANGVPIALLTDTDRVALVNVPIPKTDSPSEPTGGYAVWQTALFAEGAERDYFAAFAALLHAQRFFNAAERETLEALFERSALTQADLTKTLGLQVRKAVELLVGAFSRANRDRRGELLDALPPHTVYEAAATVMMRLVFLLYAEERDLLPIGDPIYAQNYAISTLREQLEADAVRLGDEPLERRAAAWRRVLATFNAIFAGIDHDRLRLPAYGGRLFDPERFPFLDDSRVDDLTTRAILTALQTVTLGGESRRLSFLTLDVEQIGHVYEGLLDHDAVRVDSVHLGFDGKSGAESEIDLADIEAVAERGRAALVTYLAAKLDRTEKAVEKGLARGVKVAAGDEPETRRLVMTACESDEGLVRRIMPFSPLLRDDLQGLPTIYSAGGIIVTKTRARRDSGTEYTPRVLAEEIVRYALEPLVYSPGPVAGAPRDTWQVKPSVELLALKICDPACGSGAFLVAACRYLAERLAEAWQREGRIADDDPIRDAQRLISERCLYGVDRDPMAVEMAKLSLWLLTFARHRPFSFLDRAIREGDSLIGITSLDHLKALHFDPKRGRSVHDGAFIDVMQPLEELVQEAMRLRVELEQRATLDINDAWEKERLNARARERTHCATLIADALSAIAVSRSEASEKEIDGAYVSLADLIRGILSELGSFDRVTAAIDAATHPIRLQIDHNIPEGASTRRPLHWPLEFPEVLEAGTVAFDLIVGNPPFLGGKFISGRFGTDYRSFLVRWLAAGQRGHADLVAYFFLRAGAISDRFGFIATNTIAQGDTREVALDALLQANWTISRAEKTRIWPGAAAIEVSEVWCRSDVTKESPMLSGSVVPGISALLLPLSRATGFPSKLTANAKVAFIGSIVLGLGFTLTPDRAKEILRCNPVYADILFPYMHAQDLCDRPDFSPSRWVINFHDWSIDRAASFKLAFEQVEAEVKPQRSTNNRKHYREIWWQFAERCANLYRAIGESRTVVAMPLVSKYSIPVRIPAGFVYAHKLAIFASESDELYGVLSSSLHHAWIRQWTSTLEARTNYSPTDCFENFPLPNGRAGDIALLMRALHANRAETMLRTTRGLTATYNSFHARECIDGSIERMRQQHQELDYAILASYGWSDINLGHQFRITDEGPRHTISESARIEILDRLLELNHERHAHEVATGVAGNGKRGAAKPRGLNSAKEPSLPLLGVD